MGRRGLEESYPRKTPAHAKLGRATFETEMCVIGWATHLLPGCFSVYVMRCVYVTRCGARNRPWLPSLYRQNRLC
jgi:hypothetical protein